MRTLIGIGLGLGLVFSCAVTAAQPPDAKKLLGTWEQPADKAKKRGKHVFEFLDATKVQVILDDNNSAYAAAYKVEGKKLIFTVRTKDGDNIQTFAISKLTDDVLEVQEDTGTKFNFTRVKTEAKKDK